MYSPSCNPLLSLFSISLLPSLIPPSPLPLLSLHLFQPPVAPSSHEIEEEGPASSREGIAPVADAEVVQESPVAQESSVEEGTVLEVRERW